MGILCQTGKNTLFFLSKCYYFTKRKRFYGKKLSNFFTLQN